MQPKIVVTFFAVRLHCGVMSNLLSVTDPQSPTHCCFLGLCGLEVFSFLVRKNIAVLYFFQVELNFANFLFAGSVSLHLSCFCALAVFPSVVDFVVSVNLIQRNFSLLT